MLKNILKKQTIKTDGYLQEKYIQYNARSKMQNLMRQFNEEPTQQICKELEQLIENHENLKNQFLLLEDLINKQSFPNEIIKFSNELYTRFIQERQILHDYFSHQSIV